MIKVIGDIGSNHNKSLDRIKQIIGESYGYCWGVKLQLFKGEDIYRDSNKAKELRDRELPIEWIPEIYDYCKKTGIKLGITPFNKDYVDEIKGYVDFLKISSFDILRTDLIDKCLTSAFKVIISLGLLTDEYLSEFDRFLKLYTGGEITLMHCVSAYPTNILYAGLKRIDLLKEIFNSFIIGYSDHTKKRGSIFKAIEKGAQEIEIHIDLDDKQGKEFSYNHCWTISELKALSVDLINGYMADNYFFVGGEDIKNRADSKDGKRPERV